MPSLKKQRLIAGASGIVFAVLYGFWTMIATGGGHVNFIWLWLFITVGLFGLYFPVMAVLAVDLRSLVVKLIFGSLTLFYLFASIVVIDGWIKGPDTDGLSDYSRALRVNGVEGLLFCAALHFLPAVIFLVFLVRSIVRAEPKPEDEGFVDLKLT